MGAFLAAPKFPILNFSYYKLCKLSSFCFALGPKRLSELPCMDPSTRPHILALNHCLGMVVYLLSCYLKVQL
jgi:hypothetical protein